MGSTAGEHIVDSICDKPDTDDEIVMYGTVNDRTIPIPEGGSSSVTVFARNDETLTIGTHGFECDFSCDEHWDDDFLPSPNDRIGTTSMAYTAAQGFGTAPGATTPHVLDSQPDLTTALSRHFSAGDYRMTVTITEVFVGMPP